MQNNLPLNWCECKLEDLGSFFGGYAFKSSNYSPKGARVVRITNVQKGYFDDENPKFYDIQERLKDFLLQNNDILISLTGNVGRVCKITQKYLPAYLNQRVEAFRINNSCLNFIYYFMQQQDFEKQCIQNSKGVAQKNMSPEYIKKYIIALPPLREQERIVEKIEALFADIDEGVEHLKSAQAQIRQYRQSVLKSAFEGKLYKTTDWKEKKLIDLTSKIGSGSTPNGGKNNYHTDGIPIIRSMNVHMNKFIYEGLAYLDDKQASQLNNVITQKDDVLLNITGASIGRTCLLPDTLVGARVNQHVSIVRTKNELLPQYLSFYFASPIMQTKITIENYGATRQALTKSAIENFRIQLPTLPEQQHIVEEIEKRFAVADELEKTINDGLEKAKQLKQSILKKAFEGKLVPQDPNDEPASIILERIKKEKQAQSKGRKK